MKLSKLEQSRLRRALKALDVLGDAANRATDKVDELARVHGAWDYWNKTPGFPRDYYDVLERERDLPHDFGAQSVAEALARVAQAAALASAAADEAAECVRLYRFELERLDAERELKARIRQAEASTGG